VGRWMTETASIAAVVNETDARRKGSVIGEGTIMYSVYMICDQSKLLLQYKRQDDVRAKIHHSLIFCSVTHLYYEIECKYMRIKEYKLTE